VGGGSSQDCQRLNCYDNETTFKANFCGIIVVVIIGLRLKNKKLFTLFCSKINKKFCRIGLVIKNDYITVGRSSVVARKNSNGVCL
jgi:hypothetical protein